MILHCITVAMYRRARQSLPRRPTHPGQYMTPVIKPQAVVTGAVFEDTLPEYATYVRVYWRPLYRSEPGYDYVMHEHRSYLQFAGWHCLNPLVADEYYKEPALESV